MRGEGWRSDQGVRLRGGCLHVGETYESVSEFAESVGFTGQG